MSGADARPAPVLDRERERTVDALCTHFANDALGMSELERRIDRAYAARSRAALEAVLQDLPALPGATDVPPETASAVQEGAQNDERRLRFVVAIMSDAERRGPWRPPRHLFVGAMMGGAELDFRDAALPPGETRVTIACVMGSVDIIVPPGLAVDTSGIALMGGFPHYEHPRPDHDQDTPLLRITAVACMGGVDVDVRLPAESTRDAERRHRTQRTLHPGQRA